MRLFWYLDAKVLTNLEAKIYGTIQYVCIPLMCAFGASCLDLFVGLLSIHLELIYSCINTSLLFVLATSWMMVTCIFWETDFRKTCCMHSSYPSHSFGCMLPFVCFCAFLLSFVIFFYQKNYGYDIVSYWA
jgi:hypothetical protein